VVRTGWSRVAPPAVLALFFLGFTGFVVHARLEIEAVGTIVARPVRCASPGHRCRTHYEIVAPGGERRVYVAGANDQSLDPDLRTGQRLSKRRWELNYSVDERRIDDFPYHFYGALTVIGMTFAGLAIARASRPARGKRSTAGR
jgi:hypothetical protein